MIRERKEELATTIPFVANATGVLQNGVPRDLPLTRLFLVHEGRLTISSQTVAGTIFPEAPGTLIRRIRLQGTKVTGAGSVTHFNCRGAEVLALQMFQETYRPLGFVGGPNDLAGSGGTSFPAGLAATANGSYDFRVYYELPIAYRFAAVEDETATILDPSIYSLLDLQIDFGSTSDLISGGTLTAALSAFGSATGSPQVRVMRFAPLAAGLPINKFFVQQISKQVQLNSVVAATFADQLIVPLNVGNKMRSVMLRQYQENATIPGLIDVVSAASGALIGDNSNTGVYRWRFKLNGNEKARFFNPDLREWDRQNYNQFDVLIPQGYSHVDWGDRGFPVETAFDTRGFGQAGARWELYGDGLSIPSTGRLDVLQIEQIPTEA